MAGADEGPSLAEPSQGKTIKALIPTQLSILVMLPHIGMPTEHQSVALEVAVQACREIVCVRFVTISRKDPG